MTINPFMVASVLMGIVIGSVAAMARKPLSWAMGLSLINGIALACLSHAVSHG